MTSVPFVPFDTRLARYCETVIRTIVKTALFAPVAPGQLVARVPRLGAHQLEIAVADVARHCSEARWRFVRVVVGHVEQPACPDLLCWCKGAAEDLGELWGW